MSKYKKTWGENAIIKDPGSPGDDLRDVDWEEADPRAMTVNEYKNHIKKKYELMMRNMGTLRKVNKKGMHPDEAEYLAKQEWEYKKRNKKQPLEGTYPFVYTAKAESKRDMKMYKTLKSAMEQEQDLKRDVIVKKNLFGKKKKKLGPKKEVQGMSVRDLVKLSAEQKAAREEFVMDYGDYDKAAKGLKPKKEKRVYKNNTYEEGK